MKRTAEHQLTKDTPTADEDAGNAASAEGFAKAAPDVMKKRRILKVRRTNPAPAATAPAADATPKANPFASIVVAPPAAAPVAAEAAPAAEAPVAALVEPVVEKVVAGDAAAETKAPADAPVVASEGQAATAPAPEAAAPAVDTAAGSAPVTTAAEVTDPAAPTATKSAPASAPEAAAAAAPTAKDAAPVATAADASASDKKPDEKADAPAPADKAPFSFTPLAAAPATSATPFTFGSFAAGNNPKASPFAAASGNGSVGGGFSFPITPLTSAPVAPAAEKDASAQKFEEKSVETGEEGETEVFRAKSKIFMLEEKKWKERGVGVFKMNVEDSSGNARLLMRTDVTLRLTLNSPLFKEFQLSKAGERGVTFRCVSEGKSFLARFHSKEEVEKLEKEVAKWKEAAA